MRPPIVPLRVYLLLLVLGAMLPGAVLTALLLAQTISGNRSVIERRLLDSARVDAAALDREFEAIIRVLDVLGTSPAVAAGDYESFHAEASRVKRAQRGWFSVLLLSPQGQQLVNTRLPWGTPLTTAYEPDSLREVVRAQQPVVGVISVVPPGGPGYGFAVRVPVMRNGRMAYALTAIIEARALQALVDTRLPATEEWTRTILDPVATVVARSREADRFVGQPATPSFRARVIAEGSDVFPEDDIDGTRVYTALARGRFGWTAGVMVPRGVLDAGTRGSTIALVAGATLVMLGTLAALLLISKRLARDLADVANSAEAVAEGRAVAVGPAHVTEIEWLQDSLRTAALLLDKRERERDEEVERAQEARREAEHANQTKDHFLAALGHELRNPLAPALTALELMKIRDPDVFAREREVLERQVGHMARLVNDLLDLASLARGKIALRRTRTEVRQVIDSALDMARPLMERHQHTLRVDVPPTGLPLDGDADRLVQVVTNLLTNAAKYTPRGGHVSVTARADGEMAEIVCEDDGPGVPPTFGRRSSTRSRRDPGRSIARRAGSGSGWRSPGRSPCFTAARSGSRISPTATAAASSSAFLWRRRTRSRPRRISPRRRSAPTSHAGCWSSTTTPMPATCSASRSKARAIASPWRPMASVRSPRRRPSIRRSASWTSACRA